MGAREHGRGARAGVVMPLEEQMVGACPATAVICQGRGFAQRGPGADYVLYHPLTSPLKPQLNPSTKPPHEATAAFLFLFCS